MPRRCRRSRPRNGLRMGCSRHVDGACAPDLDWSAEAEKVFPTLSISPIAGRPEKTAIVLGAAAMRYLCLVYLNEDALAALPEAIYAELDAECRDYHAQLRRSGELIVGEALQPVVSTTTLRRQGDSLLLRDGPVCNSREQPAAIYLFETQDLNDAIRLAARLPAARLGSVEVRALGARAPP